VRDQPEIWTTINGGGGWVHPMHMHQEEHRVLRRLGSVIPHPDDTGKSDTVNLDPGESVTFYRNFRTFTGRFVAHCHNLAHEDHNMMFGWEIIEP
jgi:FtsP/CotA-like multicopper oxidase with cupredoxin domain